MTIPTLYERTAFGMSVWIGGTPDACAMVTAIGEDTLRPWEHFSRYFRDLRFERTEALVDLVWPHHNGPHVTPGRRTVYIGSTACRVALLGHVLGHACTVDTDPLLCEYQIVDSIAMAEQISHNEWDSYVSHRCHIYRGDPALLEEFLYRVSPDDVFQVIKGDKS